MTTLLFFCFDENEVGCCSSHCKYFSLKHSRIVAEMNGFFGNVIMTVVDDYTCSSPVVIKLGAICVAVDVKVDRFDFFVIFLCWDVHSKDRVEVISHTVLILFTQWNGVKDSVKDFSVACEVTSGIDHRHTDPMSICLESQSAFQCLLLYPVVDRYDIVDFVENVSW